MLDIKFVRENQDAVSEAMRNRNASWDSARFSELDESRRDAIQQEEALQAERNALSKAAGAPRVTSPPRASSPRRTGTWARS